MRHQNHDKPSPLASRIAGARPLPRELPANPFVVHAPSALAAAAPADDAPEGSYEYRMVDNGEALSPADVETEQQQVLVTVKWGRNTLHVAEVDPEGSFVVGESTSVDARCDYLLPALKLGRDQLPLVVDGMAIVPDGAEGTLTLDGQAPMAFTDAGAYLQPGSSVTGTQRVPLAEGTVVELRFDDITITLRAAKRGRRVAGTGLLAGLTGRATRFFAASFVATASFLGALSWASPPFDPASDDAITDEDRYLIQQYLDAAAQKELDEVEDEQATDAGSSEAGDRAAERADGQEGAQGSDSAKPTNNHYAVADRGEAPQLASRRAMFEDAANMGMVGLLNNMAGAADGPIADWGGLTSSGPDAMDANGAMWGDGPGENWGVAGLGLSGIGEGGGGRGHGLGLGGIGTFGSGNCVGENCVRGKAGFGRYARISKGSHKASAPNVRTAPPSVSGRLPPQVIQRIVRANYGRFRACYEGGLRTNPNLQGRVAVNFVIGRDGTVSSVGGGGDLPDGGVVSCITRSFYGLTFPQPEGGIVTVSYPIVFTPGS